MATTDGELFVVYHTTFAELQTKHNRSGMVAVQGPNEALPYYIHTYIHTYSIERNDN
jgi:hypothetical protein